MVLYSIDITVECDVMLHGKRSKEVAQISWRLAGIKNKTASDESFTIGFLELKQSGLYVPTLIGYHRVRKSRANLDTEPIYQLCLPIIEPNSNKNRLTMPAGHRIFDPEAPHIQLVGSDVNGLPVGAYYRHRLSFKTCTFCQLYVQDKPNRQTVLKINQN